MSDAPGPISIWQPRVDAGSVTFVRPAPGPFGDHYAAREAIPARKRAGVHRVCFFGESVAAGYLYAPHLTPAAVLEEYLRTITGTDDWEVIDLARTNETLDSLVETVTQSIQLEPDSLVIFCGNNWNLLETPEVSPYHPEGRPTYGAALRNAGVEGPIELAAKRRLRKAGVALGAIAGIADAADANVTLVIPEVNLADWESRQPVPWLPEGTTAEWHRRYSRAAIALDAQDWDTALDEARRMLDLDDGINPATFRIMSTAYQRLDQPARARRAAELEVATDHAAIMCFLGAPRAAPMDQEVQRRAARHHGFAVVDLPAVFARHFGQVPGRAAFLDYCHLTAAATGVAMAATAAAMLGRDQDEVIAAVPAPSVTAPVEATVRLGAAIHTAHRLLAVDPGSRIVDHWLGAALEADPAVADAMLDTVAARVAAGPEVLTAAQQRNLDSPFRLGYQHGWRYDHLDVLLIDAIARCLAEHVGPPSATVLPLLSVNHAIGPTPTELIDPPAYLWEPLAGLYPDVMQFADVTPKAFVRSPWPRTEIAFVTRARVPVGLSITARIPAYPGAEQRTAGANVLVNSRAAGTLPLATGWSTRTLKIPEEVTRAGINRLSIEWPPPPEVGAKALAAAADRLERGLPADIHPVFGELFSVRVWERA